MPHAGDRYVMPEGLGEYLVVKSHEQTGGEYVEMEWTMPPGAFAPPMHRHPSQVEEYEVLEGAFEVVIGGRWQRLEAGDSASVPVNTDHTFRTVGGQTVRVRNFHRPGGRFDEFVEKQHRFVTSERFEGLKRPSTAIVMAGAWHEHADLLVPSSRPLRWAVAALAPLNRLIDY
jgi:quercetin dioxygenase-like cupin family protein